MPRTSSLRSLESIASKSLAAYDKHVMQRGNANVAAIADLRRDAQEGQGAYARQYRSSPQRAHARPQRAQPHMPIAKWLRPVEFLLGIMGNRNYLNVMQTASLGGLYSEPIILAEEEGKYRLKIDPPLQEKSPYSNTVDLGCLTLGLSIQKKDMMYLDETTTHVEWLPLCSGEKRVIEIGKLVSIVEQLLSHYPNARVGVARMRANFEAGLRMYVEALDKTAQAGR